MTPEQLDELERLEAEATPGEWLLRELPRGHGFAIESEENTGNVGRAYNDESEDAQFIAALRNNAKALIEAARNGLGRWEIDKELNEQRHLLIAENEKLRELLRELFDDPHANLTNSLNRKLAKALE